jgi:hypothetical protein
VLSELLSHSQIDGLQPCRFPTRCDVLGAQSRQRFSCDARPDLKRLALLPGGVRVSGRFPSHAGGPEAVNADTGAARAGRWGFVVKGLLIHARIFFRTPIFSYANACESILFIRPHSER